MQIKQCFSCDNLWPFVLPHWYRPPFHMYFFFTRSWQLIADYLLLLWETDILHSKYIYPALRDGHFVLKKYLTQLRETDILYSKYLTKLWETDILHSNYLTQLRETGISHSKYFTQIWETDILHSGYLTKLWETDILHSKYLTQKHYVLTCLE